MSLVTELWMSQCQTCMGGLVVTRALSPSPDVTFSHRSLERLLRQSSIVPARHCPVTLLVVCAAGRGTDFGGSPSVCAPRTASIWRSWGPYILNVVSYRKEGLSEPGSLLSGLGSARFVVTTSRIASWHVPSTCSPPHRHLGHFSVSCALYIYFISTSLKYLAHEKCYKPCEGDQQPWEGGGREGADGWMDSWMIGRWMYG